MTAPLLPGERIRCLARPHWIVLLRSTVQAPLVLLVALAVAAALERVPELTRATPLVAPVLLLALAVAVGWAGAAWLGWSSRVVVVTDVRAIQQSGIIRRRRTMVSLDRIQEVSTERGFWGGLLGFGDVIVSTAGLTAGAPRRLPRAGSAVAGGRPTLVLPTVRSPDRVARALFLSAGARRVPPAG